MDFIMTIVEQGLIYGILTLGIYITYKILDFPDLTVDGSFPLGAAVTAALITRGVNPYLTIPIAFLVGVLAGICTGLIHVKCKVRDLLSGIIMMTALYTVNLKIAGTNNVPLFSQETMFKNGMLESLLGETIPGYMKIVLILLVVLISILYKGCVAIAIRFFDPQSMKLITAVLFLVILVISMERKQKAKGMAAGQKGGKNA